MVAAKKWLGNIVLFIIAAVIHFISSNPVLVEKYYSTGIYIPISKTLKYLLGWLPFSVGDLIYVLLVCWLFFTLTHFFISVKKIGFSSTCLLDSLNKIISKLLIVYIYFNAAWGINYNRLGIASQLGIKQEKYSSSDLRLLDSLLLQKVNSTKSALLQRNVQIGTTETLIEGTKYAYQKIAKEYPFLASHPTSIKSSLWGWLGNYLGFMGYYNPFTGEAQVNTNVPKFLQPYIFCHETAHQLGYAKEDEANFVGYLAAAASTDSFFNYSVYLDLFLYAQRNLFESDSMAVSAFSKQLLPQVKADLKEWKIFNDRHRNPAEPIVRWLYGKYLINNQQPSGELSYDEVTGLLIAYNKKFGRL